MSPAASDLPRAMLFCAGAMWGVSCAVVGVVLAASASAEFPGAPEWERAAFRLCVTASVLGLVALMAGVVGLWRRRTDSERQGLPVFVIAATAVLAIASGLYASAEQFWLARAAPTPPPAVLAQGPIGGHYGVYRMGVLMSAGALLSVALWAGWCEWDRRRR